MDPLARLRVERHNRVALAAGVAPQNPHPLGVFVYGRTAYSLHPDLVFGSEVIVEAFFAFEHPEESYIELTGDLTIGGEALGANARARLDRHGLVVEGFLLTPVTTIGLHGEITISGPVLEGFAQINLGLDGVSDALDAAERDVAKARAGLEKLRGPMDGMRDIIRGERELHATKVAQARAAVETARRGVASLQSKIDANKRKIAQRKREISKKRSWAKKQKWYKKAWKKLKKLIRKLFTKLVGIKKRIAGLMAKAKAKLATLALKALGLDKPVRDLEQNLESSDKGIPKDIEAVDQRKDSAEGGAKHVESLVEALKTAKESKEKK